MENMVKKTRTDPVKALLQDYRTRHTIGCEMGFMYGGKLYNGLTKRLKSTFHPQSSISKQSRIRNPSGSSIVTGNRVHRLLYHQYHCKKSECCDCGLIQPNRKNEFVENAKRILAEEKIDIEDCEVPVLYEKAMIGTCLDMIGYISKGTKGQKSLIVSIKTGYGSGYDRDSEGWNMQFPFTDVKSSSKEHNQLQGFAEYTILQKDYGLKFDEYRILYLSKDYKECRIERPEDWWNKRNIQDGFFSCMEPKPNIESKETAEHKQADGIERTPDATGSDPIDR